MNNMAQGTGKMLDRNFGSDNGSSRKFELAGSRAHYSPSLDFTITHMALKIAPDFNSRTISCQQQLEIRCISLSNSVSEVNLDASELEVSSVNMAGLPQRFRMFDDELCIQLERPLKHGDSASLEICYIARPRKGFYFISADDKYPSKRLEAWTQGETTESKYWFPCIDHPSVKFTSDVSVVVPIGFTAISNGRLKEKQQATKDGQQALLYSWSERRPHPAYLTSVVVGTYAEIADGSMLYYYVPEEYKSDVARSFERTPEMLRFFEDFFGVKYPYEKYSQVTVQDFVYGGMENSSCTTLTTDTLHDSKAHIDYTSDHLVSHELAHQWFGDLVTCRDWSSIWLNEGFATYCEALYWEASRGRDEFLYYIMQTADDYFEEAASRYTRPIVTKVYKHPDDLFDRHTYEKGGMVLHMLRHEVGNTEFRKSVGTYLNHFADKAAETFDLRRTIEDVTGKSLEQFFEQWIYRPGHPQLKVQISLEGGKAVKVKVEQVQPEGPFEFSLDVRVAGSFQDKAERVSERLFTIKIEDKETVFQLPLEGERVEWVSVDPEFKVLKMVSVKAPKELLTSQLKNGLTVIERVEAARALASESSEGVVYALNQAVSGDEFWGVAAEAAKSLGIIRTDTSYRALLDCLSRVKHPKVRRAVVKAIGEFRRPDSTNYLLEVLEHGDSSYFVESEAALALGKTRDVRAIPGLKRAVESNSFQNIVAQGGINGLKEFADDKEIATFILSKSEYGNHHRIREVATFALGRFLEGNPKVFSQLRTLLTDSWFRVRINACRAFAEAGSVKAIPELSSVAERDSDHRVRRVADECIIMIRESSKRPRDLERISEEMDKLRSKNLEMMQKMDRLEREMR